MSAHIDTRRKLQSIPLVNEFEAVLAACTLTDEDKEIVRLHYLKGKDFAYIGDTMGYAERTIKLKHKRALEKIAKAL